MGILELVLLSWLNGSLAEGRGLNCGVLVAAQELLVVAVATLVN